MGPTNHPTRKTWHHGQAILGDSTTSGIYTSLMSFARFAANIAEIYQKKVIKNLTLSILAPPRPHWSPDLPNFHVFLGIPKIKRPMPWFLICQVWSLMIFPRVGLPVTLGLCHIIAFILLMEEIRRSPVEVGSLWHYLQGFIYPRWCRISSINSKNAMMEIGGKILLKLLKRSGFSAKNTTGGKKVNIIELESYGKKKNWKSPYLTKLSYFTSLDFPAAREDFMRISLPLQPRHQHPLQLPALGGEGNPSRTPGTFRFTTKPKVTYKNWVICWKGVN